MKNRRYDPGRIWAGRRGEPYHQWPCSCQVENGENPVKCGGKVLVIDGGFSRAYQKETGIAGYTLIYNSYGLILAAHEPFESRAAAIEQESDIYSEDIIVKRTASRKLVGDTDTGQQLKEKSQIWNSC